MSYLYRLLLCLVVTYISLPIQAAEYVGTETCKSCHVNEWQNWTGSHHQLAMAEASESTVLADFNNTEFRHNDTLSKFRKEDGSFYISTENAVGAQEEFRITHTFGWEPLQQYLVSFEDGRKQVLNISWDTRPEKEGGQRWFHLYPDEVIEPGDLLHWTAFTHNWNTSCAACHSTNLEKNYDPESNQFDTSWSEINVACEACHGAGEDHLDWASSDTAQMPNSGFPWSLKTAGGWGFATADAAIASRIGAGLEETPFEQEVCAQCHSLRSELQPFAGSFHDAFQLSAASEPLYHIDGQIREEVFVVGSFMQSRMHDEGVTCSNCHDPHTLELVAEPNQVCSQCHIPKVYDTPEHHFHPIESAGALCIDCHMPTTNFMIVDPRRDHSIRIPRPDLSLELDTPNACSSCHADQSQEWAAEAFSEWWPDIDRHYAEILNEANQGNPASLSRMFAVLSEPDSNAMARYKILQQVSQSDSPNAFNAIRRYTQSNAVIDRQAAINALAAFPTEQTLGNLLPLLEDKLLSVRIATITQLASIDLEQLNGAEQQAWRNALTEAQQTLQQQQDSPGLTLQLSNLYSSIGDSESALKYVAQALVIAPNWPPALINQAALYSEVGDEDLARASLRRAISAYPEIGDPYFSLGLSQIRTKERDAALLNLKRAADLSPNNAHYGYVYGIALYESGQTELGIEQILTSYEMAPSQTYIGIAAASYQIQLGQFEQANVTSTLLRQRAGENQQVQQITNYLLQFP